MFHNFHHFYSINLCISINLKKIYYFHESLRHLVTIYLHKFKNHEKSVMESINKIMQLSHSLFESCIK